MDEQATGRAGRRWLSYIGSLGIMKKRNQIRLIMLFPALMLGGFILSFVHVYWTGFWLTEDSSQTTATINDERSHGVVDYSYTVAGGHYVGHSQRSRQTWPGPAVGGQAPVYFSASHPWLSSLQPPTFPPQGALFMIIPILFELLFVMTIIDPKGKWALQTGLKESD